MRKLTFSLLACACTLIASAQVYVKPAANGGDDANDGLSWATAKATVSGAIPVAKEGSHGAVWVQKGTYVGAWGASWNNSTMGGVSLYGGFNGDETSVDQRAKGTNPWDYTNETIIQFGLGSGAGFQIASLPEANKIVIDGFSFSNMGVESMASVQLRDNSTIQNCKWSNNTAGTTLTAPLLNFWVSGGLGAAAVKNCLFENNIIPANNIIQSAPTVVASSAVVEGCLFVGNEVSHRIIATQRDGMSYIANNVFYNNKAAIDVIGTTTANNQVVNCLVYNNEVGGQALAAQGLAVNNTVVNNKASKDGGFGAVSVTATAKLYNTIVRGNVDMSDNPVGIVGDVAAEVKNCNFNGTLGANIIADNNYISADATAAGFVSPSAFVGRDMAQTAALQATNWELTNKPYAYIGMGDNTYFLNTVYAASSSLDLAGNTRIQQEVIDLGALESSYAAPANPTLTVAAGTNGATSTDKSGQYFTGEGVAITSTPADGYMLKNWTVNGTVVSVLKDFEYIMTEESVTLTANFEAAKQFTLTVVAGANGTASVDKSGTYFTDEVITLTATPNADYVFSHWSDENGVVVSQDATFEFTMPESNITLTANFKYHLTRYLISEKGSDITWARAALAGETIINLTTVGVPFDEFVRDNMWPSPLADGDEVWLIGDWYEIYQPLEFKASGVKWYGGFEGKEISVDQRSKEDLDGNGIVEPWEFTNQTVFDGQMQNLAIVGTVLQISQGIVVDGVVIQGGRQGAVDTGSGVRVGENNANALPTVLRNSVVRKNLVTGSGSASAYVCGAVVEYNSTMDNCLIEDNLMDATNTGATYGAGATAPRVGSVISNCVVRNNRNYGTSGVNNHGGGLKVTSGKLINCLVYNNIATRGAGIYVNENSDSQVQYCTIVNNESISYVADGTQNFTSGAGIYFRGRSGGGFLENSIIWGNKCTNEGRNNIYIETDGREGKVCLGANAFNGGADDLVTGSFTPVYGNDNTISDLASADIFIKPSYAIGYISDPIWECDWTPSSGILNIGVKLAEGEEYDFFGNIRPEENLTLGAIELNAGTGIEGIVSSKDKLDPFVYYSTGKVFVDNMKPVSVEIYTADGVRVAASAAAPTHSFVLPSGIYLVSVKDGSSQITAKVVVP